MLHRELYDWNCSTVAAEGGDVGLALALPDIMRRVGLSLEEARGEAILLDPEQPSFLPTLTQVMLPRMVERSVATAEQVDIATLPSELRMSNEPPEDASSGTLPSSSRAAPDVAIAGEGQFLQYRLAVSLSTGRPSARLE